MRASLIPSDKQFNILKGPGSGETDAVIAFNLTDEVSTDEYVADFYYSTIYRIEVTLTGYHGALE